jgi:histidinol-phosphate phosphatase family protein
MGAACRYRRSEINGRMRVVFLDRDGVINANKDGGYITRVEEFSLLPHAVEAIKALNDRGFEVIIVSNQAGIAKGAVSWQTLEDIEQVLRRCLCEVSGKILAAYYCPHLPEARCRCRKPEIGLFLRAARDFAVDFKSSVMIGDALTDIEAGKRVGCYTILVKTGRGLRQLQNQPDWPVQPDKIVEDLAEGVALILSRQEKYILLDHVRTVVQDDRGSARWKVNHKFNPGVNGLQR